MKFEGEVTLKSLIRQLQHGFKSLSRSNLISSSGFQISVAGLLGLAGFVLALKDSKLGSLNSLEWLPKTQNGSSNLRLSVPGLLNLGNNCFLNVVLQALASCSYFQPFLQKVLAEYESSAAEDRVDGFPLAIALVALLEDLCVVGGGRVVLSPRRVMLAMEHYIQNFDLASEQDAAEAFLHLLSSLREELSDCYLPNQCSLVEVFASNCKIITPTRMQNQSELERWQKHYLGPFDGILGSILTCGSCASQISLNFESFHSLPLSPVLDGGSTIRVGCTLEDCLKQFTVAEQVDYHCSHCWHIAAVKYLFARGVNEVGCCRQTEWSVSTGQLKLHHLCLDVSADCSFRDFAEIEEIEGCTKQDSCDCRRLFHLDKLPWSNKFSQTLKQISIARCPKILCIHLKRVSVNVFGELVKLQYDQRKLNHVYGLTRGSMYVEESSDVPRFTANAQELPGESSFPQTARFSKTTHTDMHMHSGDQLTRSCEVVPLDTCLYRLVAVVEHFGRAGSGHYTVYRSVRADLCEEEPGDQLEAAAPCWFSISDSEVCRVSEEDVVSAEANVLFYEKYQG